MNIGKDQLAYLSWALASLFWVAGFIYPNEHHVDSFASNLSRGAMMYIFNAVLFYLGEGRPQQGSQPTVHSMSPKDSMLISMRHAILTVYGFAFAEAQYYLPSPIIYTVYFSGPLFVVLLDYLLFKRVISGRETKGIILAIVGVLMTSNGITIKSWFTGESSFETEFPHYKTDSLLVKSLVGLLLSCLTFGWASAIILVRYVKCRKVAELNMNFGLIMTLASGVVYIFYPHNSFEGQPWLFAKCMLIQGVLLALAQHFFMLALVLTSRSGITTMVGFVGMVFSYFLSVWRYSEPLNGICVGGAALVIFGVYLIVIK